MKLLLDTHTLLWFLSGDLRLSPMARKLIEDAMNEVILSVGSVWEIGIKAGLGKILLHAPFEIIFPEQLEENGVELLPITVEHVRTVISLPFHHRDPFDRLLVAQALVEGTPILSADAVLDAYGITRLW